MVGYQIYPKFKSLTQHICKGILRIGQKKIEHLSEDPYFSYKKPFIKLCPENGIILDIGSEGYPFPKATIIVDSFLEPTQHRSEKLILENRDFCILNIEFLPLKNKSIDYIYCSHILEHLNSPRETCNEISRVGKAGYIETPNFMKDTLFARDKGMHIWHTIKKGNKLIFFEYSKRELKGVKSSYWRETVLDNYYHPNQDLFRQNQEMFNTMFGREDDFSINIYPLRYRCFVKVANES